ncbi:glycosyltransferase [Maribacter sp. R77961]|uniref:glycosyltransferase n=1 Tax=Maribacter sp. R77961 TaxID=3093871 RepID=UPI0037CA64CF
MKPTIHLYNNIASHYTEPLMLRLLESEFFDLKFSTGENKEWDIATIDFSKENFSSLHEKLGSVNNIWIKGKYLFWQQGVLSRCLFGKKVDLIILLGEFAILSNWLGALACRLRGIPVAFRGHGLYGNEGPFKLFVRKTYYRLANMHMLYERRSKQLMIKEGFIAEKIHVVFNSLDYDYHKSQREKFKMVPKSEAFDFFDHPEYQTLLFIGRLTKIKRLHYLIETAERINENSAIKVNLLIIGDGSEKESLEKLASKKLDKGNYHFFGSCYDESIICKLLSKADLCVSPGNVGLTCIHSLSMGTPVCTHNNFNNQMPEVEAIEDGKTGVFFEENNKEDMYLKTKGWLEKNQVKSNDIINDCYEIIDKYYNPFFQEKVYARVVQQKEPIV